MSDGVYLVSKKTQFVPVEIYFLDMWSSILQKAEKGSAYVYICMQRFTNNQSGKLNGKIWVSIAKLSAITGYGREKIINCKKVLEAYGLIVKTRDGSSTGSTNTYIIPDVPEVPQSLLGDKEDVFSVGVSDEVKEALDNKQKFLKEKVSSDLDVFIKSNPHVEKWSPTKFYKYYALLYHSVYGVSCGKRSPSGEDLGKIKNMLETYSPDGTKKIIDKAIRYWSDMISPITSPLFRNIFNKRQDLYNIDNIPENKEEGYYEESDI